MIRCLQEGGPWLPLLAAVALAAAMAFADPTPALALAGMARTLTDDVQRCYAALMDEVQRLRGHGLPADVACDYLAEKVGIPQENLNVAHFVWLLENSEPLHEDCVES